MRLAIILFIGVILFVGAGSAKKEKKHKLTRGKRQRPPDDVSVVLVFKNFIFAKMKANSSSIKYRSSE